MGMYDEVICEYPITGGLPTWITKHPFQTKDLECSLQIYYISTNGSFSLPEWTGVLNFYTSNVVGSGPGIYTANGEDAEYLDCTAKIVGGKISGDIQVERKSHKAWPSSKMHIFERPTKREVQEWQKRIGETLIGKRLYVLWGGQDIGYWAIVVAENSRQLCVRHEADAEYHKAGDFELLDRRDRDRIFWDTETEALAQARSRKTKWNREKAEFEALSHICESKGNCPEGLYWEMAEIREKAITDAQAVDILKGLLVAQPLLPVTDLGKAIMRAINKLEMQKTDSNVARDILADMDTLFEQKAFVDYHVLFDTFRQRVRSKYGIA